jgi:hypothetical protein
VKHTKKPTVSEEFLDAFADVIADRVATKLSEASKPAPPQTVPRWLPGPKKPTRRGRSPADEGRDIQWKAERALRNAGFLTFGDPGHDEVLKAYLEQRQKREAELARMARMAQMRKAAALFERLVGSARTARVTRHATA